MPRLNSRAIALLDHAHLVSQLCALERRCARGGKDSIDHAPHAHDDVANAAAGCLVLTTRRAHRVPFGLIDTGYTGMTADEIQAEADREFEERKRAGAAWLAEKLAVDRCYFPGD